MKWVFISDVYRGKVILSFPCPNEQAQALAEEYNARRVCFFEVDELFNLLGMGNSKFKKSFDEYTSFVRRTNCRFYVDVVVPQH